MLFCDNRSRLLFESAIYETTMPQYRFALKKSYELEKIKVYNTTFNAGNSLPTKDLDLWLKKSKECDVIAIAVQECDTAEWLEAIQAYFAGERFVLVTLVTMWRVSLNCEFFLLKNLFSRCCFVSLSLLNMLVM